MEYFSIVLQILIGLGILNVWLLRSGQKTGYRGGHARTLKHEFEVYGLPTFAFYLVGTIKIAAALALIVGIWMPILVIPAALMMIILMLGALAMHIKVKDPVVRSIPAGAVLIASLLVIISNITSS